MQKRILVYAGTTIIVGVIIFLFIAPTCIVAGTMIDTPSGPRPVEDIQVGDPVWSMGPEGRVVGTVAHTWANWATCWVTLGELRATPEHPVRNGDSWTPAGELTDQRHYGIVRVHDLQVEPHNNFFAGGRLVHNKTSGRHANELSAIGSLKHLSHVQVLHHNKKGGYWTGNIAGLGDEIQKSLADAEKNPYRGYLFAVLPGRPEGFAYCAWPNEYESDGVRTFILCEDGIVWQKDTGGKRVAAWPKDPEKDGWKVSD